MDRYPKINDIFKTLSLNELDTEDFGKPPDVLIKNLNIDLEKLNMSNFGKKIKQLAGALVGNATDEIDVSLKEDKTRRLARIGSEYEWKNATKVAMKNKIFDLMLQTIYMARHKIKQVENEPYFNPADTSYRIAFLYRRLRRIWKKMLDIYTTMEKKRYDEKGPFTQVDPYLVLHHKAAKLHVDFLYLWWVVVRLHERYEYRHGISNTLPGSGTTKFVYYGLS